MSNWTSIPIKLPVRLVGKNPLFGHLLRPAWRRIAVAADGGPIVLNVATQVLNYNDIYCPSCSPASPELIRSNAVFLQCAFTNPWRGFIARWARLHGILD